MVLLGLEKLEKLRSVPEVDWSAVTLYQASLVSACSWLAWHRTSRINPPIETGLLLVKQRNSAT